jgi:prophage antirepressor-like protein
MTNTILMPSQATHNPFSFSNSEIRTAIDENGHVFFGAKDVVLALEMTWRGNLSLKNIPQTWRAIALSATPSGTHETIFISEPALFMLAFRSSKSEAVKFTQWVCEDVLPAIKKQGYFGTLPAKDLIALRNQKIKLIQELVSCRDRFAKSAYITTLRNICNQLGEPMPNTDLLGQQLELEV